MTDMNVEKSNRIITRILMLVAGLAILVTLIWRVRSCDREEAPTITIQPSTAQESSEDYIEEETGYSLPESRETVSLTVRLVGNVEIWEGLDAAGAKIALVCDPDARTYTAAKDGVHLSTGTYLGRDVWTDGQTVFRFRDDGTHCADDGGFRAVVYTCETDLASGAAAGDVIRFSLPDIWLIDPSGQPIS